MKPVRILALAAVFPLTACSGLNGGGATDLRAEPLPAPVAAPCDHPSAYLGVGDWEIMAGRIGDALLICRAEKALAVNAYEELRAVIGAEDQPPG